MKNLWKISAELVCVLGLFYNFIAQPVLEGLGYKFPKTDIDMLMNLFYLFGMHGFKTYEKLKNEQYKK